MFECCYKLESTIFSFFFSKNCKSQVSVKKRGLIFSPILEAHILIVGVQSWEWESFIAKWSRKSSRLFFHTVVSSPALWNHVCKEKLILSFPKLFGKYQNIYMLLKLSTSMHNFYGIYYVTFLWPFLPYYKELI